MYTTSVKAPRYHQLKLYLHYIYYNKQPRTYSINAQRSRKGIFDNFHRHLNERHCCTNNSRSEIELEDLLRRESLLEYRGEFKRFSQQYKRTVAVQYKRTATTLTLVLLLLLSWWNKNERLLKQKWVTAIMWYPWHNFNRNQLKIYAHRN